MSLRKSLQTASALENVSQLSKLYEKISRNIDYNQKRSELLINKKKKKESQLKEEDKIYILTKNLKITRTNKKLNYKKVDLFKIKMKKSNINYKLKLPKK